MALQRQKPATPVVALFNSGSRGGFVRPLAAFHRGLKEAGYKGPDVAVEYCWADGKVDELPALAAGLFRRRVNVVAVTGGITPARAAADARKQSADAKDVPLVFSGCDPDEVGLVNDFEHPEHNATGVDVCVRKGLPHRPYLVNELVPGADFALIVKPKTLGAGLERKEAEEAAAKHGRKLLVIEANAASDFAEAFASCRRHKVGALLVQADAFFTSQRKKIVALAARDKLPAIYPWRDYVEAGGLMSYGPNLANAWRQVGFYSGMILRGKKPAELPVLQNSPELVINLKAAKAIGLVVPPKLLAQADEIIE
jgi:putative tryptophan/tyrosine transport system substrate-binding protein